MQCQENISACFIRVLFPRMGTQQEQVSLMPSVRVRKLGFVDFWSDWAKSFYCSLSSLVAVARGGVWCGQGSGSCILIHLMKGQKNIPSTTKSSQSVCLLQRKLELLWQLIPALGTGERRIFWNGRTEAAFAKYTLS